MAEPSRPGSRPSAAVPRNVPASAPPWLRHLGDGLLVCLGLSLLFALAAPTTAAPEAPPLGPASRDLVALRDFDDDEPVPDLALRQERAAAAVPVHYVFDREAATRAIDGIRTAFRLVRPQHRIFLAEREQAVAAAKAAAQAAQAAQQAGTDDPVGGRRRPVRPTQPATMAPAVPDIAALDRRNDEEMARLRPEFEALLLDRRGTLDAEVFATLRAQEFTEDIELLLSDAVQVLLGQRIVRLQERLQDDLGRGVLDVTSGVRYGRGEADGLAVDLEAAQQLADRYVEDFARRKKPSRFDDAVLVAATRALVRAMVVPTFVRDLESSHRAEQQARAAIPATRVVHIARGQSLVKRGDMVTPKIQRRIQVMLDGVRGGADGREVAATLVWLLLMSSLFAGHVRRNLSRSLRSRKDAVLLATVLLVHAATLRALLEIGDKVVDPDGAISRTMVAVVLPHALGPTLATLFLRQAVAVPFTVLCAGVAGLLAHGAPLLRGDASLPGVVMLCALVIGFAGVFAARRFRTRADLAISGLQVSIIGLLAAGGVVLWTAPAGSTLLDLETARVLGMGGFAGALGYLLVAALTPLFESAFNRLTDIKLLELTSMNHPALRLLATETPGTFTHSVMVGNLAEAACDAIGANGLLARVGAYYHDVGKTAAPLYFAENQSGDNPHDRLKPHLSALIIRSHVTDGIRLLREFGLPEEIVDFVPQHHGTSLIEHFYNRARREAAAGEHVDEADFRYPGPKPQSKETALLMIADTLEAAAKALPEATPDRVRALVGRLIARKLEDNQLDECDMTLRELAAVEKAFTRTLIGMHHTRPVYLPGPQKDGRRALVDAARAMQRRHETVRTELPRPLRDTAEQGAMPIDAAVEDEAEPGSPTAVLASRQVASAAAKHRGS